MYPINFMHWHLIPCIFLTESYRLIFWDINANAWIQYMENTRKIQQMERALQLTIPFYAKITLFHE